MKKYNSNDILNMDDLYELQDSFSSSGTPFQYEMTEDEINWALFIKDKYCIADFIFNNLNENTLTFNCPFALQEALNNDGIENKGVMLSDDTALQRLFFWLS